MPTTGSLIRKARLAAGLSQNQLARKLNITGFLVSHWEANRKPVLDMEAVAAALGVTVGAITGDPVPLVSYKVAPQVEIPVAPQESAEPFLSITNIRQVLSDLLGVKANPQRIHEWVQTMGLPAYKNPLRKNINREPTLLFRRSEVVVWAAKMLTPVANQ